jgi:selenium donor protein
VVAPDRVLANRGARPGDSLILTKPIGTGVLSTAMKQGLLSPDQARLLYETMAALNRAASEAVQKVGAHSCTDVTGFGLLGHLMEMLKASGVAAPVRADHVPLRADAVDQAASRVGAGGTKDNEAHTASAVRYGDGVPQTTRLLLNDAQTSGGLLVAVAGDKTEELMSALREGGVVDAARIGEVVKAEDVSIDVI